ncbi:MAG: hypothetical protein JSV85_06970 [Candidatus Bathyarchaeota archaeon]|nr:MAG: hypothetical protein JSV85_06970 [Candidatus Bathyarchaeota archaeon]
MNLFDPVVQMFIFSLIVVLLPTTALLFLVHRVLKKSKRSPKANLKASTLVLVRLVQVALICAIAWFVGWAHIYEVLVWQKPFTQTFYISFGNVLAYVLLSIALVSIEYTLRRYKRSSTFNQNKTLSVPTISSKTLLANIQKLEHEKEAFRRELWELKRKPRGTIGYVLFASGAIALALSVLFESAILAFIGLGLTFWGGSLTFVKPRKYVKTNMAESTAMSSLAAVDKIIGDLGYRGKGIYLPPRRLKEFKNERVFISSTDSASVPPTDEIAESTTFVKNPQGMLIVPPGLALVNLFEEELKTDFAKADLYYLQANLPKLLIEDLEMAKDFKMKSASSTIHVKIEGYAYREFCEEASKLSTICGSIGCPVCSAIAIALTRATGKPVVIEKNDLSSDGKTLEIQYRLMEAH